MNSQSVRSTSSSPSVVIPRNRLGWWQSFSTAVVIEWRSAEIGVPWRWISWVISPMTYVAFLGVGLAAQFASENYLLFMVPGIVVMQAIDCSASLIYRTVIEKRWGLAAWKMQCGMSQSAYMLALLSPYVFKYLIQSLAVVILAICLIHSSVTLGLIAIVFIGVFAAIFWGIIGMMIASLINSYQTRDVVVSLLFLPLTFAAPVLYSIDTAPSVLQWISVFNPVSYQVTFLRDLSTGVFNFSAFIINLILFVVIALVGYVCIRNLRQLKFEA